MKRSAPSGAVPLLLKELKKMRTKVSSQQIRTLKGQILAGDIEGAERGLKKLKERMEVIS